MRIDLIRDDVRLARRSLTRDRSFTAMAVLVLALGIGATTAIFSLVNSVLLRPLAFRDPDALFVVREGVNAASRAQSGLRANARHFMAWRAQTTAFESMALVNFTTPSLTGLGEPERLEGARVSAVFFDLLGARVARGRAFVAPEEQPGRDAVIVVSDAFWRRLGADPGLVGRRLTIDGDSVEVVGILAPDFRFARFDQAGSSASSGAVEVFRPWPLDDEPSGLTGDHNYLALARLKAGVTVDRPKRTSTSCRAASRRN